MSTSDIAYSEEWFLVISRGQDDAWPDMKPFYLSGTRLFRPDRITARFSPGDESPHEKITVSGNFLKKDRAPSLTRHTDAWSGRFTRPPEWVREIVSAAREEHGITDERVQRSRRRDES